MAMEAVDEPLFQEVLCEVNSSNPLTLSLFADRLELASEEPRCCKGGKRSLDDGNNRNITRVPFDKMVGCHILSSSMTLCDDESRSRNSSNLGIYAYQEHSVNVRHERGKY